MMSLPLVQQTEMLQFFDNEQAFSSHVDCGLNPGLPDYLPTDSFESFDWKSDPK
jgi:hypothetical protein